MAFIQNTLTDPDDLNTAGAYAANAYDSTEVKIDPVAKTFQLKQAGNLSTVGSGATGQCVYSFLKDRWKDVTELPQFDFPMLSITNEQFEFINGWRPADDTTRKMIRFAGWAEVDTDNQVSRKYSGLVSLGTFVDNTDAPYFTQNSSYTATTTSLTFTGPANEAVQIYGNINTVNADAAADDFGGGGDATTITGTADISFTASTKVISKPSGLDIFNPGEVIEVSSTTNNNGFFTIISASATEIVVDGTLVDEASTSATLDEVGFDFKAYFKLLVRELGKIYDDADLVDIGVTNMTYIVYRFPLTNSTDLKWGSTLDTDISSGVIVPADVSPYNHIALDFLDTIVRGNYATATAYEIGDVVLDVGNSTSQADGFDHWFKTTTAGTSSGADVQNDIGGTTWVLYTEGEREVTPGTWSAFTIILDGEDTIANSGTPYTNGSGGSALECYLWSQWALRLAGTIDEVDTSRNGEIADSLVYYIGNTLHTIQGVFIDTLDSLDANNVTFHDWDDVSWNYPLTVNVTINFNSNLYNDTDAVFYAYYDEPLTGGSITDATNIITISDSGYGNDTLTANTITISGSTVDDGTRNITANTATTITVDGVAFSNTEAVSLDMSNDEFGTIGALQVQTAANQDVGEDISHSISTAGSSYGFSYAFSQDTEGGRTPDADTPITVVAIGLSTGQYVKASGTITNVGVTISLVAPLERNYSNPA